MDDWTNGPASGERLRPISLTQTQALKMKGHSDGPPPTSPGGCKPGGKGEQPSASPCLWWGWNKLSGVPKKRSKFKVFETTHKNHSMKHTDGLNFYPVGPWARAHSLSVLVSLA